MQEAKMQTGELGRQLTALILAQDDGHAMRNHKALGRVLYKDDI
jgi:hypothetical protein